MGFRFRRRTRLFPGLHINWSKNGLSSISIGAPGATLNIPVARSGRSRATVGIPGTGLSWTEEAKARPSVTERRQRQSPKAPTTEQTIELLLEALTGPDRVGDALWRQGLAQRVIDYPDTPRKVREAALLIRSPEAAELHCRRAKGAAATRRAAMQVIDAAQAVLAWTEEMGWSYPADE